MPQSTVSRIRGKQPVAQAAVSRIRGRASTNTKSTVSRIRGRIASGMIVDAGSVQTVEPFETVQLDATVTEGPQPTTWTWTQIAGPPVAIVVTGLNGEALFKAMGPLDTTTLAFQVRAALAGYPDAVDTTTVTVRAHTHFRYNAAGVLVGIEGISDASPVGSSPDFETDFETDIE